jgi:hypothetical protein
MANNQEEKVPGVTLYFQHSSFQKPQATEKYRVKLALDCAVNDEALWQVVETKFKAGFRVFTSEDFHVEVLSVLREEFVKTQNELAACQRDLAQTRDELAKYKGPLAAFGRAIR